jgi:hypothetical protein
MLEVFASGTFMAYQTTRCHMLDVYSKAIYYRENLQACYTNGLFYQLDVQILMFPAVMTVMAVYKPWLLFRTRQQFRSAGSAHLQSNSSAEAVQVWCFIAMSGSGASSTEL